MNTAPKETNLVEDAARKEESFSVTASAFDVSLVHAHRKFLILLGVFVVLISFSYGLFTGLNKQVAEAVNMTLAPETSELSEEQAMFLTANMDLVDGLELRRIGEEQRINAQHTEVLTVLSNVDVEQLLDQQVKIWQQKGYRSFGATTRQRGVALAFDESAGRRYSMLAWTVPPTLRRIVSEGMSTQGVVSYMDEQTVAGKSLEEQGEVPGVPLMPGGHSTAVFSARDLGVRSFSASYTNLGTLHDNMDFYKNELGNSGWIEQRSSSNKFGKAEVGYLLFSKQGQELTLLLAPVPAEDEILAPEAKTTVQVSLSMGAGDA